MKALIVDSDLAARGTLRRALDSMKDVEVVKECATIDDAITAAGPSAPELWIIESWLPGCGACYLAQGYGCAGLPAVVHAGRQRRSDWRTGG